MSNIALVSCIDTHAHLDGEEYAEDRREMIERARAAGVSKVFLPAIDLPSVDRVVAMSREFPDYCYPMIGLHPEEVRADYKEVLAQIYEKLSSSFSLNPQPSARLRQETLSKQSEERTLIAQPSTLIAQPSLLLLINLLEVFLSQHKSATKIFLTHYAVLCKLLRSALK